MARRGRRKKRHDDSMLTHGVIAILLVTFAIITFLSFFDKAGTVGVILNEWILSFLFGSMRYFVPVIVVILAWYIVTDFKYDYRPTHGLGALLFFVATSSLLHLRFPVEDMWLQALEGHGGGMFGMVAWALKQYLGTIAAWVILIAAIAISILLLFNTSLMQMFSATALAERFAPMKKKLEDVRDGMYDEEDEEEWDEEEDEEYDEEEDEEEDRFASKRVGEEEEDEEEYEQEDEEDTDDEEDDNAMNVTGAAQTHTIDLDPVPAWQKNAVIKPLPPIKLLQSRKGKPSSGDIKENQKVIKDTLKEFRINVAMEDVRVGPTVTQYSLKPAKGVKLSKITSLSNDLALALAAHPIRIEAPIPGKSLVGIEVPNDKTAMVSLREMIESPVFKERKHNMMIGLGKDVGGKVWFADLPRMPHLLIAGATGSGKTVCMNTIITSLLYQNTAETLRMIMVDPKRVELTPYNGIPHLLTPVITNVKQTVNALKWTINEMDRRFELLSQAGNRNINTYNDKNPDTKLPYIVFIIDELADLMAMASNDVEAGIIRLAQMARAVGIHLIVATQRPSVDVITGLMKANIPGRIAFSVASITDSRTILDTTGAEKLIGKGDMLLMSSDFSKPIRIQGAFISEEETKRVIKALKSGKKPVYDEGVIDKQDGKGTMNMFGGADDDRDALFHDAKAAVVEAGKASASFLQRKLKVGYARAARILDELEEAGVIGPSQGSKPRDILITEVDSNTGMGSGQELNVFKQPEPEEEEEYEDDYEEDDDDDFEDEEDDGKDPVETGDSPVSDEDEDEDYDEDDLDEEEDEEYDDEDEDEECEEEEDDDDDYEDEEEEDEEYNDDEDYEDEEDDLDEDEDD